MQERGLYLTSGGSVGKGTTVPGDFDEDLVIYYRSWLVCRCNLIHIHTQTKTYNIAAAVRDNFHWYMGSHNI